MTYEVDLAYQYIQNIHGQVVLHEAVLGVSERWTAESDEYKQYHKENVETSYRKAVDEMEKAVVMRIWELTKMRATGTGECGTGSNNLMVSENTIEGYKLRQHIAKALSRRSETVRKAIKHYNDQAALLDPPTPPVTWEEIAEYTFVGEFDLLRITRSDIRKEKWTQQTYRAAAVTYFKTCRAWEELQRLNIEVRRLHAFIREEAAHMDTVIKRLSVDDPSLADELCYRWTLRSSINSLHLQRLRQLECQPYYTGSRELEANIGNIAVFQLGSVSHSLEEEDQMAAENKQDQEFEIIVDFVANIT